MKVCKQQVFICQTSFFRRQTNKEVQFQHQRVPVQKALCGKITAETSAFMVHWVENLEQDSTGCKLLASLESWEPIPLPFPREMRGRMQWRVAQTSATLRQMWGPHSAWRLTPVWPWPSYSAFLHFTFLVYKVGVLTMPTSKSCCKSQIFFNVG